MNVVRELLASATARLGAAGVESPEHDAAELLAHVLGTTRSRLPLVDGVDDTARAAFGELVSRRERREPLQHLTGAAAFRHVRSFWLGVHWIAERAVEWGTPVSPEAVIDRLVPDLLDNIEAGALAVSDGPRPNPGPWCDRCSYRELCPASRTLRYEPVEYYEDDED